MGEIDFKQIFMVFCSVLAPEVLAGRCPPPCNRCTREQIQKVMSQLSQRFPREFQEMMANLNPRG